jgi:signal transduction histidine kinase/DNA-binding response OmpR family regulator
VNIGQTSVLANTSIRALAAVPLRVKDAANGRLFVAYHRPHSFTEDEARYLNAIADSASLRLDNILLFDQIQTTLEETSILYQASRALSDASGPQGILDVVVNYLIQPHVNQVFIALLGSRTWDTPGATVQVVAAWSEDGGVNLQGISLTRDQFPAWNQLATPIVVTIDDVYADDRLDPLERIGVESLDARSVVVIPLRVPQRAIGAIWIGSREPYRHAEREARIYQALAEQASLALEAGHLLEQTERRARQLETSSRVSQTIGQILDLDVLLPQLVHLIRDTFGYDHVQVFLMDEDDNYAVLRASTGEAGRQLLAIKHKLQKKSQSVIGQVTAKGVPQIALDTADAAVVHKPNPYLPLTRSEMALPLITKGKVAGALDVQSNQPNAFGPEDVEVLTTLAAQISVAIDNARLYEDAQQRANQMSFLFDVTTAAASAETLKGALENVAQRLHDTFEPLSVAIYLPQVYVDTISEDNRYTVMQVVALAGAEQPLSEISEVRVNDPHNLIGVVSAELQPMIIGQTADEPRYVPIVTTAQSAMIVPLSSVGQVIGLINMEDSRPHAYDRDTLQVLLALSGSLSAIIQNALLLEQMQRTNEQLRELDRLKSDFLANMSHELRTPLNSIIGFSRVMLKGIDGTLTEMQEQDLTTIYNSGQHLLMLINDILDQAKIAAGKMDLKFAYFEIKPLIESVRSIGIGLVKDKPIQMLAEIAPVLPKAYGDEFRTRQVLLNLVSNASKFTQEGSVTIRAYPVQDEKSSKPMIRVDVLDTGIGIAERDMPLLFEAFRQVDSSLTRTAGGTGLGLPIAKSLIEMQGGTMMVTSKVNAGSTFSIAIPTEPMVNTEQANERDTANEVQQASPTPAKRERVKETLIVPSPQPGGPSAKLMLTKRQVLLIEDSPDLVDQFRRALQREGFEVFAATIPLEAEAMASGLRPTVIIMDVNFAGGKGWNILSRIKERDDTFDIPVVVITLSDESERAYNLGVHSYLQRPFMPEDLTKAVLEAEKESRVERILIIDDQPDSIRLLKQLLNEHGKYRVFSAGSGSEGISMVARRRPDLIILDLRMPEMDGFAVLDELRSNPETAKIPVMVVTGDVVSGDEQQQLANIHVLQKTDINQDTYERFIMGVKAHLEGTNGSN